MVISSGSELRSSGCSWCRSTILLWRYTQNSSLYTGNSDAMGCSVTVSLPHSLCTEAERAQYNLGWLRGDLIEITQFPYNIDLREASVRICYFSPPRANINIARFSHTNQTYMPKLKGTTMSEKSIRKIADEDIARGSLEMKMRHELKVTNLFLHALRILYFHRDIVEK